MLMKALEKIVIEKKRPTVRSHKTWKNVS